MKKQVGWIIVVALIASVIGNIALSRKVLSLRTHVQVNDEKINKRLFYGWLEQRHGREATAEVVLHALVTQAAAKAGIKPDEKEIKEAFQNLIDMSPQAAIQFRIKPWTKDIWMRDQETKMALLAMTTKDVKASDDELRDHFNQNPGKWDDPDKLYYKVAVAETAEGAQQAKEMMEKVSDVQVLRQQLQGKASVVGFDGTWMFPRKLGAKTTNPGMEAVANLKPSNTVPYPVGVVQAAKKQFLVMRMDRVVPGRKVTFEQVKDKVARDFKSARATPAKEVLRKLWDNASISAEDPGMKEDVERLLFPERVTAGKS